MAWNPLIVESAANGERGDGLISSSGDRENTDIVCCLEATEALGRGAAACGNTGLEMFTG